MSHVGGKYRLCRRSSGEIAMQLLVVVCIVAVLLAVFMPTIQSVGEGSRRAACASNLRQLGAAVLMYASDYDQALPGAYCADDGDGDKPGGWVAYSSFPVNSGNNTFDVVHGSLFPYSKTAAIYVCPDDSEGRSTGDSYALNSCVLNAQPTAGQPHWGKNVRRFTSPSRIILLGEEAVGDVENGSTDDAYLRFQNNTFSERHSGETNVVFLDGHVKAYFPDDISTKHLQSQTDEGSDCPP